MSADSLGLVIDKNTVMDQPWVQAVNDFVFYGFGLNNFSDRGSFVFGRNYAVNDYVVYPGYSTVNSGLYICISPVTNAVTAPPLDPTHWGVLGAGSSGALSVVVYIDATAGTVNFDVPALSGVPNGFEYLIFKTDASANPVNIVLNAGGGSDVFCGPFAPLSLTLQGASTHLKANKLLPAWMVL